MKKQTIVPGKKAYPSISIIIPTHRKYPHFKTDEQKLKSLIKEAESRLAREYSSRKVESLIDDLHRLERGIDYRYLAEGLALYCSPYREKVVHLPFEPEEKLIIDKSFEVRDMLYAARKSFDYAVVAISQKQVRVFKGFNHHLTEIVLEEMPRHMEDVDRSGSSRTGMFTSYSSQKHFSDQKEHVKRKIEKYLREIDRVLYGELRGLPILICADRGMAGQFRLLTKNKEKILGYVSGNYEHASVKELIQVISPVLDSYEQNKQEEALDMLEKESRRKKITWGIEDVYRAAAARRGHLLVVEKGYSTPAIEKSLVSERTPAVKNPKNILSDAVDDAIEHVVRYGGDVAFVDDGKLEEYGRIALITRY